MRWRTETREQWRKRVTRVHMRYAWLPVVCNCGTVVWLEYYWTKMHPAPNGRRVWENRTQPCEFAEGVKPASSHPWLRE